MGEEPSHRRPSIATIFNPRRSSGSQPASSRPRPSVVVTDEDTPIAVPSVQFSNGGGSLRAPSPTPRGSIVGGGKLSCLKNAGRIRTSTSEPIPGIPEDDQKPPTSLQKLKMCIFSLTTRKILAGIFMAFFVTSSWVGATHLLKDIFNQNVSLSTSSANTSLTTHFSEPNSQSTEKIFDAPFFATWFCTAWCGLFFPLYLLIHSCFPQEKDNFKNVLKNIAQHFRERGITFAKFVTRCVMFCLLWVTSNYLYANSLRILDSTDVMALFSAHISFVYLLAWVILHEQFVGVRIVAVIMCSTGIALLAYMDGITKTKTLLGVVMAAASAAGSAVFKVLFRKIVGERCFVPLGLYFSCIAFLNSFFLSPFVAVLYLTEYETIYWTKMPWANLLVAATLSLASNLLVFMGISVTFELFITLGIIMAVPISAAIDVEWYGIQFEGMKLAGIVLITCGFFLVLFPSDWPHYITKLLRWGRHRKRHHHRQPQEPIDYRTGLISRSHLRSPSGLIR